MNQNLEENVRQILSRWTEGLCPGGQVLIRKNGETFYEGCFGYGNLENRIPITADSIFHIASISKQFTVLAVLLLQEDGLLSVDDDIRRYVNDLIHFEEPVTLRQMFNNVSGIRDQWELLFMRGIKINDSIDMEDVNETIRLQKTLNFPPQEGYLYSNTGFHLLSVIVERVSGMPFPQFVRKRIFLPLHMENTMVRSSYSQVIPGLAYSYQDDGTGTYYYNPLGYSLYGPTSVNTCVRDLVRILEEYRNPTLFSRGTVDTVLTAAKLKDGSEIEYCGGMMAHVWNGMKVYEHGGADAAYRAQLLWIPEKELEVVLLSNTTTYAASVAAKKLAALALGMEPESQSVDVKNACEASADLYVTAAPDDPFIMEITERDGAFFMKREYGQAPLIRQENGSYRIGPLDEYLVFHGDTLEHLLPARSVTLRRAQRIPSEGCPVLPGTYYQDETRCMLTIRLDGGRLVISHPRYGETPLYFTADRTGIFGFGPDFVMYVSACEGGICLDGYRARRMVCHAL
ncbi:MAG: beta-lactamase family protein [Clostridium sp.]|nr:beta-lactamase family protein [Clostridium sp.]